MPHFQVLSGTEERGLKLCMRHRRQLSSQFDALGPSIPDSCCHPPEPVAVRPFRVSLPDRSRGLSQFQARISGPSVSRYVHDCPPDRYAFACVPAVGFTPDLYTVACNPIPPFLSFKHCGSSARSGPAVVLTWDDICLRGRGDLNRELRPAVMPGTAVTTTDRPLSRHEASPSAVWCLGRRFIAADAPIS